MHPKISYILVILVSLFTFILLGTVFFLFSQQQKLQRSFAEVLEKQRKEEKSQAILPIKTVPPGPIYGDIGVSGEFREEGEIYVFKDWNAEDEIREIALFASDKPEGGELVFKIVSGKGGLPKPYVLGTVPNGSTLVEGKPFSKLSPGKYRYEITALQKGLEIKVLGYLAND